MATDCRDAGGFRVVVGASDGEAVLRLVGELDLESAPLLLTALNDLEGRTVSRLIFDMADLVFIDSSGLHVLVTALSRQQEHGGEVVLRDPSPQTVRVLEIAGVSSMFIIG